ncbi:hypothetical protein JG688_00006715 [Phytophthora aleatoria]|uniref:Uncharacterized protein n=1 Tax=Phytophthora aleatoria TaxID=2496075 RepID=A0A8J5IKW1_9STRA|nr:hypothetical protein JG688_00006715 [Phytophthora aleatoria]
MESAVRRRHYKVARWLKEYVPYESTEEELDTMVEIAVNDGAMEFAEYLMPADREILEYIHERAKPEAVEWVLEREDVKKNQDFGAGSDKKQEAEDNTVAERMEVFHRTGMQSWQL